MNSQKLRECLQSGRRVYGTLLVSASPVFVQVVKRSNLDLVFIDTEHMPLDRHAIGWMCQTYQALDVTPIVRIPSPDPYQATMALDAGAGGIIAPYVETPEQVRTLRGAVKLRPIKGQLLEDYLRDDSIPPAKLHEYLQSRNQELLIVNIESVPAIKALDSILAVPGLDGVLVGPHDLSCSLGHPEEFNHPEFEQAIETIIRKARAKHIGVGIHTYYPDSAGQLIKWSRMGANLIVHRGDVFLFQTALQEELQAVKTALDEKSSDV